MRIEPTSSSVSRGDSAEPRKSPGNVGPRTFSIGFSGKGVDFTATKGAEHQEKLSKKASLLGTTYLAKQPNSRGATLKNRASTAHSG